MLGANEQTRWASTSSAAELKLEICHCAVRESLVSLSWSSVSSAAEHQTSGPIGGAGGTSPAVSPASSARSSLSAADEAPPRPPLPPPCHGVNSDISAADTAGANALQGAAGRAYGRTLPPPRPAPLARARTGPPDFVIGVWPPPEAAAPRLSADGGAPARVVTDRPAKKQARHLTLTLSSTLNPKPYL